MKIHLTIVVAITILLSSCVSYFASPPIPVPEVMPYSYRDSYFEVYADPYLQFDRQWRYFGANLTAWRVIAIQVLVRNKSDLSFALHYTDIWLELPEGAQILRTPSRDFYEENAWSEFGNIFFQSWTNEYLKRMKRFTESELDDVVLNKDDSVHGFVFFVIPRDVDFHDIQTLVFRFVEENGENIMGVIRLPLNGLSKKAKDADSPPPAR